MSFTNSPNKKQVEAAMIAFCLFDYAAMKEAVRHTINAGEAPEVAKEWIEEYINTVKDYA